MHSHLPTAISPRAPRRFLPALVFAALALVLTPLAVLGQSFVAEITDDDIGRVGPTGMAIDTVGGVTYLYASDQNHGRVVKYNLATGARVAVFGTNGNGQGQFNAPYGIAIDPATHDLYVAERANYRIQRITNQGVFVMMWGQYGTADGQFNDPVGIAADATGNVYITDHGNHRVQKFHVSNTGGVWSAQHLTTWGGFGGANGQFNQPYGITLDASGVLWVADGFNHRLQRFDQNGTFLSFIGSQGSGNGQFITPTWVTFDAAGNYYVAETNSDPQNPNAADIQQQRIQKFSPSGAFITKWGSYGQLGGQFRLPFICVVDNTTNYAYVADYYNTRIQKFNLSAPPGDPNIPIVALPAQNVAAGGTATFTATVTGSYQWQKNGTDIAGANAATLTLTNVQPADCGVYSVSINAAGQGSVQAGVLGITSAAKTVGTATEVGTDIHHPNGNIYDQVLLQGPAATIRADAGQITRISYVDLNDDIVQVEFSGSGNLTLMLDNASGPANATNYNQPSTQYWKGHGSIVITGADASTNVSVFSVGRGNAVDQTIFRTGVTYDSVADIAMIAISGTGFGGVYCGNANLFASKGITGLFAPGVQFGARISLLDVNASGSATPTLLLGGSVDDNISGGDLLQTNGKAVQVSGISQLKFVAGAKSDGVTSLPAQINQGHLEQNGVDVTATVVVNPH
ncbi:MAG TPA: hypothetical protein VHD62_08995 [Opitutaceae bacterium]|nr:hypothetical protein [Opitutaceae bacterium]